MNSKKTISFFTNVEKKLILVTPALKTEFGEYPNVTVLMFDGNGNLKKEECPVNYVLNEYDEVAEIEVTTGNKNGLIIIS